jgi:hypothetical protein
MTAASGRVEFNAGDSALTVMTQGGTACSPSDHGTVCELGELAPQDSIPLVVQTPSGTGVLHTPLAHLFVQGRRNSGEAIGVLPATTLDKSSAPTSAPHVAGIAPAVNFSDAFVVDEFGEEVPQDLSLSQRPRIQYPYMVDMKFVNSGPASLTVKVTLNVFDTKVGAPQKISSGDGLSSQGTVHTVAPGQGLRPASGLTWDLGTVAAGRSATLSLDFLPSTSGPFELRGQFEAISTDGQANRGAWVRPLRLSPPPTPPAKSVLPSSSSSTSQTTQATSKAAPVPKAAPVGPKAAPVPPSASSNSVSTKPSPRASSSAPSPSMPSRRMQASPSP